MTIVNPIITPLAIGSVELTNITPFTYRDGLTYVEVLQGLRTYITQTLVPEVESIVGDVAAWTEGEMAALVQYVDNAVKSIIGSSVDVQDPVVAALIANELSATRTALDALFVKSDELDDEVAAIVVDDNSATGIALLERFVRRAPEPTGIRASDTAMLQGLIDTAIANGGGEILLAPGTYEVSSLVVGPTNTPPKITGVGVNGTVINGDGNASVITFIGDYPDIRFVAEVISGVTISSEDGTSDVGIEFRDCVGAIASNIVFSGTGVLFHNYTSNHWTEFCEVRDSWFDWETGRAVEYKSSNGTPSFHGSGLRGRNIIETRNSPDEEVAIYIGAGARPYNAPLEVQIFARDSATPLIQNAGDPATFFGQITLEPMNDAQTNGTTIADGQTVFFAGPILAYSGVNVDKGSLRTVREVHRSGNPEIPASGRSVNVTDFGANTQRDVLYIGAQSYNTFMVVAKITNAAGTYDYRQLLMVNINTIGANDGGSVTVLATMRNLDTPGYGAPAWSVPSGASPRIRLNNTLYNANGISVSMEYNNLGDLIETGLRNY